MTETRFTLPEEEVFRHGRLPNIHPGEILREEVLEALGITAYQLAQAIGVEQTRISQILHAKRGITADTAVRLGRYLGTSASLWMGLQAAYDLRKAEENLRDVLPRITPREPVSV